ncbi:MAG: tellurium resistance protein [Microcystis flos-aquae TF09]|uniref:Tellurium resistance protein n=1 Tax=Microcystis flos-aquae TF09 TaxID=2060473 RepID=A0A3E0L5W5_9CHRO|nr:MAG: tellurium resistance protein [Microcystis flos-aquae TF09]
MPLPGEGLSSRPLHFIWICDCSGSMSVNGKIQVLNTAIREAIPLMQKEANENPNAQVLVRALKFSSGAQWHIAQPTPVENFKWTDLTADGVTDMGKALSMVADQLKIPPMTDRALPPVLVLISDGQPTDDFSSGLRHLMEQPWGKKAVRIAIAVGGDADHEPLQKFIGHSELRPLQSNSPENLVKQIKWVSTVVLKAASSPSSQSKNSNFGGGNVPIPVPQNVIDSASDVW